jgi:hypothetical protein
MSMENHSDMISTGKLVTRPPELSGTSTIRHQVAKHEEVAKERNFASRCTSFILRRLL